MFITESLALGKPVILSDNNGMEDMIVDGLNGYVTKTGDAVEAAKVIKKLMSLDEKALTKMGEESRKIYEDLFSASAVYKQFDDLMTLREI